MKKFDFRLHSVLRWRGSQLQIERAKLSKLAGEEARLKLELEALATQRREAVAFLENAERFETVELRAMSAYLVGASARENDLHDQIARRQQMVVQQRAQVLEAERNVRLLEKLREKRLQSWNAEYQKQLDSEAEESWLSSHFGGAASHGRSQP